MKKEEIIEAYLGSYFDINNIPASMLKERCMDDEVVRTDETKFKSYILATTLDTRYCQIDFIQKYHTVNSGYDICVVIYTDLQNIIKAIYLHSKDRFFYTTGINCHHRSERISRDDIERIIVPFLDEHCQNTRMGEK